MNKNHYSSSSTLVPRGTELGVTYLLSALSSDAGYADLPLPLLGAPVDIGALVGHGLLRSKTETGQAALPGQDHMYPFGVIGVAPRYIPAGAVIELAGFRLGCTSTPTGIRETQAGGNRIQGSWATRIPWWF